MRSFVIAMVTMLLYMAVAGLFSLSYNVLTDPFQPLQVLLDLAIFGTIYIAVFLCFAGVAKLKGKD